VTNPSQTSVGHEAACVAAECPCQLIHDMRRSAVRTFERAGAFVQSRYPSSDTRRAIQRRYAIVDERCAKRRLVSMPTSGRLHRRRRREPSRRSGRVASPRPEATTGTVGVGGRAVYLPRRYLVEKVRIDLHTPPLALTPTLVGMNRANCAPSISTILASMSPRTHAPRR
jgi:hypothetical protein